MMHEVGYILIHVLKVHLKSRGTDCKISDHFYISQEIFVFSLEINYCG